jgi:hypothetical protein
MTPDSADPFDARQRRLLKRRLARLREELADEAVPLPVDTRKGLVLLEELDYARQPPLHEGRAPRYGALVSVGSAPNVPALEASGEDLDVLRRMADGRASFVVRGGQGRPALAYFDRSLEYESSAIELHEETGAYVIQRGATGKVRVCGPEGVVMWDGVQWDFKPLADRQVGPISRLVPQVDPEILIGMLQLCVHWLSPGRVGATLVVGLDGDPVKLGGLDLSAATPVPPLNVTRRDHFSPLLSLLSQVDGATLVDSAGEVSTVQVGLQWSDRAGVLVAPTGGLRHTSARRFSFDEPGAVVFVVSQDGPASVFSDGALVTAVRSDPCRTGFPVDRLSTATLDPAGETGVQCAQCEKELLVDEIRFAGWAGEPERAPCPVCGYVLSFDAYRSAIRGVRKSLLP